MAVSRGRVRSAGAAVTFAVAAAAGVAGNRLTGRVTPALVVFAGLVVAGILVTYLVDRSAGASRRAEGAAGAGGDSGPADLRGARGVQIGDGNRQENYFGQDRDG